MLLQRIVFCLSLFLVSHAIAQTQHFPRGTYDVTINNVRGIRTDLLKNIAPIITHSIAEGKYPGAVILIAHHGQIVYRGVFGSRRIVPTIAPMEFSTQFDIASLTKVVATTPAIMQLVEHGQIALDLPVAKYWPEFAAHGKENVTVRELLTHTSGLPADLSTSARGYNEILHEIMQLKLKHSAGTEYIYSDINFIVLAHLVERITKQPFIQYVQTHILNVLNMKNTTFLPPVTARDHIAPTEIINKELRWGVVQDPMAYAMGGAAGNAGLFSTAADLGAYAQCLLNGGRVTRKNTTTYLLGPLTILKMTTPQIIPEMKMTRGLGWDIDSPYSSRGVLLPIRSFGHTGWTGTSLWIDPVTQTWIVVLTSRTHPKITAEHNEIVEDRRLIANMVAASITDVTIVGQHNTGQGELMRAYAGNHNL